MHYLVSFGRFWYDFIVGDEWRLAVGVIALALSAIGAFALNLFGYAVETGRLWDAHISYRAGRLPWEQHPLMVGVGLLAICALARPARPPSDADGETHEDL